MFLKRYRDSDVIFRISTVFYPIHKFFNKFQSLFLSIWGIEIWGGSANLVGAHNLGRGTQKIPPPQNTFWSKFDLYMGVWFFFGMYILYSLKYNILQKIIVDRPILPIKSGENTSLTWYFTSGKKKIPLVTQERKKIPLIWGTFCTIKSESDHLWSPKFVYICYLRCSSI